VSVSQMARNVGKLVAPLAMTAIIAVSSVEAAFIFMGAIGLLVAPLILPLRTMDDELQSLDAHSDVGGVAPTSSAHE
jgi:sugar phosphate permease